MKLYCPYPHLIVRCQPEWVRSTRNIAGTHRYIHTYTHTHTHQYKCHAFHRSKIRPSDHMMWNTSSVHLSVTGRMHGVSALHTFQNLFVCSKEISPIIVYIQITQTTILEMCSGTLCVSMVSKLHYLLFHKITFQGEETMTPAGISCW